MAAMMRARFPRPRDLQDRFEHGLRGGLPEDALDLSHAPRPLAFPPLTVSAAFAFRVLEHDPQALARLEDTFRVLRHGGILLVHVAHQGRLAHPFQARVLVEHAGFEVIEEQRFNILVQPLVDGVLRRVTRPDGTRGATGRIIGGLVLRLSAFGAPVDRVGAGLGLGSSTVLRARKP